MLNYPPPSRGPLSQFPTSKALLQDPQVSFTKTVFQAICLRQCGDLEVPVCWTIHTAVQGRIVSVSCNQGVFGKLRSIASTGTLFCAIWSQQI